MRLACPVLVALSVAIGAMAQTATGATASATSCLWSAPSEGTNFPDRGARYRFAEFRIPAGATLSFRGRFAPARYQALASYDEQGTPVDTVRDYELRPRGGGWRLRLTQSRPDEGGRELFAPSGADGMVRLIRRVYLPRRGTGADGGAGAPRPRLRLADGRLLTGAAACAALDPTPSNIPSRALGADLYRSIVSSANSSSPVYPAFAPPRWEAFYNVGFAICQLRQDFQGCGADPPRSGSLYSDQDIGYVATAIDRRLGRFLVLEGQLPVTPGSRRARRGHPVQLRYWSLCSVESFATVATRDCVFDEGVRTDRAGRYRIVVSRAGHDPRRLARRCGLTYLDWPERGDGAGTPSAGGLLMRNLLPSPGFRQAIQRTRHPGDERRVMGGYLPRGRYVASARALHKLCRR